MPKVLLALLAILLCCTAVQGNCQNIEGQIVASQFGQFQVPGINTGSLQFSPDSCQVSGGGKNFAAFSVGVPIKIVDANPALNEVDTPTAVFPKQCAVSMATTYIHTIPFYLTSGTGGLQEAIINGPVKVGGANTIILNADWYAQVAPSNPATVIASVKGNTNLGLVDVTTIPYTYYSWNGTQYIMVVFGGASTPATSNLLKGGGVANSVVAGSPNVDYLTPTYWSGLTGCGTAGYVFTPQSTTCVPQSSGAVSSLTTNGTSGAATLASGVLNIPQYTSPFQSLTTTGSSGVATLSGGVLNIPQYSGGGSQQVIYASTLSGVTGGQAIAPGSSATGDTDSSTALNTVLATGNKKLVLDAAVALSTSLVMYSGDTIECPTKDYGLIMMVSSNLPPIVNEHPNAPTTSSGTGGYVVSNQTDQNLDVHGCMINANSTQAVTGTQSGVAHKYNPATGLWVTGPQFIGVNGLRFENNEVYDAGTYGVMGTNDSYANINSNYIHFPTPIVSGKNTACIQFVGPDTLLWTNNNRVSCGDDSIAFNADDGNRTGSGDPNSSYGSWPGTKWGPIIHVHADGNIFDASYFGFRLLSATELIDDISVTNSTGNLCGNTFTMAAAYPGIGYGNVGTVSVDGWNVPTSGSCNIYGFPYNFYITENYASLSITNLHLTPGVNWPIITHNVPSPGTLSIRGWDVNSSALTGLNLVSFTGGAQPSVISNSLLWTDNSGNSGSAFSGSATPAIFTCSNYAGPNRLLSSGFLPATENGDCFTNTYNIATTYVNTTFNELSSGNNLAASTPATCINGCTGTWTASADQPSTPWQYSTNSISLSHNCVGGPNDGYCPVYINVGTANFTARWNVASQSTQNQMSPVVRWTNASNFITFQYQQGSNAWQLYDVVSGTTTLKQTCTLAAGTGAYTLVANGTSISISTPGGTCSGTVSGGNTATTFGLADSGNFGSGGTDTITTLSIKSF